MGAGHMSTIPKTPVCKTPAKGISGLGGAVELGELLVGLLLGGGHGADSAVEVGVDHLNSNSACANNSI